MKKMTVTVKWFNTANGFGFFQQEGGKDIFVHQAHLEKSGFTPDQMQEGASAEISFVTQQDGRLSCATIHSLGGVTSFPKHRVQRQRKAIKRLLELGERLNGVLKYYNSEKGYGFLKVDGADDVFFHISAVPKELDDYLVEGTVFEFVVGEAEDGRPMANIQCLYEGEVMQA